MKLTVLGALAALTIAAPAFAVPVTGTTTATFVNPQPTTTTYSGIGTNQFTWGDTTSQPGLTANRMTFASNTPFSSTVGDQFKIGSLSYYNGTVTLGTTPDTVGLSLVFNFTSPGVAGFTNVSTLGLVTTPNLGVDPNADADYVYLPALNSSSNFSVNGQNYTFSLLGFKNVTGDGFLNSTASEFHVREGGTASADLFGVVNVAAVPEPATWAMMVGGFGLVGGALRRRKTSIAFA